MTKLIRLGATGAVLALVAASAIADARQAGSPFGAEGSRQPRQPWHHTPSSKRSHHSASAAAAAPRTARKSQAGSASYYANRFHGRKTASGRPYHKDAMTAAHRTLPLGTWVRVTSVRNNRSVVVQITDRGPYYGGRIIDLSRAAATELDMLRSGTARVHLEILQEPEKTGPAPDRSDLIIAFN
jgi:rare lipoprotein A